MSKAGGSKADTAVKLVLIFFISLLSFTVGTLVGGQFEKSKSYQATLETEGGAEATEVAANEHVENAASPISDEDIEGLEDFVKSGEGRNVASTEEHVDEHAEAPAHGEKAAAHAAPAKKEDGYTHASQIRPAAESKHAAPVAKAAPAPAEAKVAAHPTEKAAERLANDKAPTADAKKAPRQPSAALPAVATSVVGKYTVQVASYATENEARGHATRLHDKGFNAFYIPAEVSGKTWYRVSIGRFDDQKAAMAHRKEVLDAQAATSAIVQKILK